MLPSCIIVASPRCVRTDLTKLTMEKMMKQKLTTASVGDLIKPGTVEIDLLLADNSGAVLRMNVFVAGEPADKLAAIRARSDPVFATHHSAVVSGTFLAPDL